MGLSVVILATLVACGPPPGMEDDLADAGRAVSLRSAGDDNSPVPLAAAPAPDDQDEEVPEELTVFSSVDDLLHVMQGQAAHLMEAGEVARDRIEDGADGSHALAPSDRAALANLAEGAQLAAGELSDVVDEVARELGIFIPAGATGSNNRVIEKLTRVDAKRFPDLYVEEQLGTLGRTRRVIKATKRAFKLHPKCLTMFERAASRINRAFEMFDFVRSNAVSAMDDPVQALRFGVGVVDKAGDFFHDEGSHHRHSGSESESEGEGEGESEAESGEAADRERAEHAEPRAPHEVPSTPRAQAA